VARGRGRLFPVLPHQGEANRRARWLRGAFEQLRAALAARLPEDDCQRAGASALGPPGRSQRAVMPPILQKVIAGWRNRIETAFAEITGRMELARHGAHSFRGLLARASAAIAARALVLACVAAA
jgi:hypothetical protein